jgi:hypothetical protein
MAIKGGVRDAVSSADVGKISCRSFGTPRDKSPRATERGAQRSHGDAGGQELSGKLCRVRLNCVDRLPYSTLMRLGPPDPFSGRLEISCRCLNLLRLSSHGDWPPSGEHGRSGAFLSGSNPIHVDHSMRTGVYSFCSLEVSFLWGRTYSGKTVKANRIHCVVLIQAMSKLISIDQTTDAHGETSYGAASPPGDPNSTPVTFYGSEQYRTRI